MVLRTFFLSSFLFLLQFYGASGSSGVEKYEINSKTTNNISDEDLRYEVLSVKWHHVEGPFVIVLWLLLAGVAKIVFHIFKQFSSIFPDSSLLIVVGLIVGIILFVVGTQERKFHLSAEVFFLYLLPPIVFDAGYFMPNRAFFDNFGSILVYAVIGTIWNMLTIGSSLYLASLPSMGGFSVDTCFLSIMVFAALISAVDPVAVLVVFEEINVHETLYITVFGESLLNDAVTVVLYHMFLSYTKIGVEKIIAVDIVLGCVSFFAVGLGGMLIGVIYAYIGSFLTKYTKGVRVLEPLFIFLIAYGAYLTAETFELSAILAIVFCGIVMKQYIKGNISQKSQTTVKYALKMLSSSAETVIFMFLGLSTVTKTHHWDTKFILLTLLFCLLYRTLGVLWQTFLLNKVRLQQLNKVEQFIMAYGGLRGAVAYGMAVALPEDVIGGNTKLLFITACIVVIYFTVFLQGMTIKPLVNLLKVKTDEKRLKTLNEQISERLFDHTLAGVEDILGYRGHNWLRDKFEHYNSIYLQRWFMREPPNVRDTKIIRAYTELSIRDAEAELKQSPSFILNSMAQDSIAQLIRSHSYGSFKNLTEAAAVQEDKKEKPENGAYANPCLDINSLDPPMPCKKQITDSKVHHLVDEHMYKPRIKVSHTMSDATSDFSQIFTRRHDPVVRRYSRQRIEEEPKIPLDSQVRHRERYHLRHLLSQKEEIDRMKTEKVKAAHLLHPGWSAASGAPPKKSVSFSVEEPLGIEAKLRNSSADSPPPKLITHGSVSKFRPETSEIFEEHDSHSEDGDGSEYITFAVKNQASDSGPDDVKIKLQELEKPKRQLTKAETTLPWKRPEEDSQTPSFRYENSRKFSENEKAFDADEESARKDRFVSISIGDSPNQKRYHL